MSTLVSSFLYGSLSFLQVTRTAIKAWMSLISYQITPPTTELAALERLKINVKCLAPSFLIGSYSFLQVTRTGIKSWMGSKFGKIGAGSAELYQLNAFKPPPPPDA